MPTTPSPVGAAPAAVDLLDPDFYRDDPHPAFTWMRANDPVHRDEVNGLWAVSRHADVLDVERRSNVFSSQSGYRSWWAPEENNIISLDDPAHVRQRRIVSPRFTPRAVRTHSAWLAAAIDELLDAIEAAEGERVDVVESLAAPLPCRLTARLIGFDEDRWQQLKSWSERLMRIDQAPRDAQVQTDLDAAIFEFAGPLMQLVAQRTECPADDLISTWVSSGLDDGDDPDPTSFVGSGFGPDTGYSFVRMINETGLFIAGGAETTRTVISHGLAVLADHPDQWDLLGREPELVPTAVEELLRWVTPLNNFFRTVTEDSRIGDVAVAAGDRVILLYPSANRDEAVFDEPFTFDVTRSPNPHLAFGQGTHFCVGANLARLELVMLFTELTRRFRPPVAVEPPVVEANIFARAVRSFPMRFEPRESLDRGVQ